MNLIVKCCTSNNTQKYFILASWPPVSNLSLKFNKLKITKLKLDGHIFKNNST